MLCFHLEKGKWSQTTVVPMNRFSTGRFDRFRARTTPQATTLLTDQVTSTKVSLSEPVTAMETTYVKTEDSTHHLFTTVSNNASRSTVMSSAQVITSTSHFLHSDTTSLITPANFASDENSENNRSETTSNTEIYTTHIPSLSSDIQNPSTAIDASSSISSDSEIGTSALLNNTTTASSDVSTFFNVNKTTTPNSDKSLQDIDNSTNDSMVILMNSSLSNNQSKNEYNDTVTARISTDIEVINKTYEHWNYTQEYNKTHDLTTFQSTAYPGPESNRNSTNTTETSALLSSDDITTTFPVDSDEFPTTTLHSWSSRAPVAYLTTTPSTESLSATSTGVLKTVSFLDELPSSTVAPYFTTPETTPHSINGFHDRVKSYSTASVTTGKLQTKPVLYPKPLTMNTFKLQSHNASASVSAEQLEEYLRNRILLYASLMNPTTDQTPLFTTEQMTSTSEDANIWERVTDTAASQDDGLFSQLDVSFDSSASSSPLMVNEEGVTTGQPSSFDKPLTTSSSIFKRSVTDSEPFSTVGLGQSPDVTGTVKPNTQASVFNMNKTEEEIASSTESDCDKIILNLTPVNMYSSSEYASNSDLLPDYFGYYSYYGLLDYDINWSPSVNNPLGKRIRQ